MRARTKTIGRRRAAVLLALAISAGILSPWLSRADWTATGNFEYTDRTYNQGGFTGTAAMPVREADVEVYDVNTSAVLAQTATDSNGDFSILVTDASTRDVGVRVLASTTQTPVINFSVVDDLNGNAVYSYHDAATDVTGHGSTTNVNFGTMTMPAAIGPVASTDWSSQIFNTLDLCVFTADWIASVDGARPPQSLTVGFNPTSGSTGSSYSGGSNRLNLSDDDGYDDANILHEVGHWVEDEFGRSRNIGGSHSVSDDDQDPRLAWSEGFATVVSGATLHFHGLPFPNVYSDRPSFDDGGSSFAYNFESTTTGGSTQERAVTAAVYDLIDDNTADDGNGTDDDPLGGLDSEVWQVLEQMRVLQLPATSLEDFWDLWRDLGLGNEADVQTIFAVHSIDFLVDSSEPDDLRSAANTLTGTYVEHTFYRSGADPGGDEDWYQFAATAGTYYRVQVNGAANQLFGRPDPEFYLLDTDGETVLAFNDDPHDTTLNATGSSNNNAMIDTVPEILWRAPATGTYYVYCRHSAKSINLGTRYGTYKIRVVTAGTPSPTITTVASQRMLPGQTYQALIIGTEMAVDATVATSSGDVTVTASNWIAPEAIAATFAVAGGAATGSFDVTVSNPGAGSDTDTNAFTIDNAAQPPVIVSEVETGVDRAEIKNIGTVAADLTGWQIIGRSTSTTQQTFTFPSFTLAAGATVRVFEGSGTDTATELYDQSNAFNWGWGTSGGGDVSLLDDAGRNVDYIRWIQSYMRPQNAPLGTGAAWMQPEMRTPASGFTVSVDENAALTRTTIGTSLGDSTMPVGAAGRDNAVDAFEDNDEPRRAPLVTVPATIPGLAISPRPGAATDDDWFGVSLSAGDALDVSALFTHATGNLDLEVYAPGEESVPLLTSTSATDNETVSLTAPLTTTNGSGVYRVRVIGAAGATNSTYALDLAIPVPPPGEYFTELFDGGNPPDLADQMLTFFPNGSLEFYKACRLNTSEFPVDPSGGTPVVLTDDGSTTVLLGGPLVELYGASYGTIHINANGNITFAGTDGTFTETLDIHFNQARISGWFDDLDPSAGGTISHETFADRFVVTFEDVPEISAPANTVSFQVEMFTDGSGIIRVTHLGVLAGDGIVGLSSGPGATPVDYAPSDLSAYTGCLLADWKVLFFGPGSPPGSGDFDDIDGDGILNIWEYANGTNPLIQNVDGVPKVGIANILGVDNVTFTYDRLLNNTDLTYTVESSIDLIMWAAHPDALVGTTNFVETRRAVSPLVPGSRIYFRLQIDFP